ncbi:MAG: Gldg family protein [Oscillospiraceae bacterium]|nr:Gldg family protein [Oscillospiraceae bacterium]
MNNNTKKRFGSFATLLTVIVIVAVILLNMVSFLLTDRFNLQLDLTPTSAYSLTEEGMAILDTIDSPTEIAILAEESTFVNGGGGSLDPYFSQANTVIKLIAGANKNINLQYVDLDKNPTFKSKYPDYNLAECDVIVESEGKVVHLSAIDLFNVTTTTIGTTAISSSKAEEAVLSAMLVASSESLPKVTVVQGYDEFSTDTLTNLLMTNAYEIDSITLSTVDAIDPDTDMLLICSPKRDYTAKDLDKLDAFLLNGGNYGKTLMYFADTEQPALPNLEGFLKEWGVEVQRGTVFETNTNRMISNNVFWSLCDFVDNDFTANMYQRSLFPTLPYCRPLKATFTESGIRQTHVLSQFTSGSGIYPENDKNWKLTEDKITGNVPGIILCEASVSPDTPSSYVVVFGTVNFINEEIFSETSFGNAEFALDLTNQLVKSGEELSLTSKKIGNGYLSILQDDQQIMFALFVVILPVSLLVLGVWTFFSRRHL